MKPLHRVWRLFPASFRVRVRSALSKPWFRGPFSSWSEASQASSGYDDQAIVARVVEATIAVSERKAAFERDGVLFMEPEADKALWDALMVVHQATGGALRVLDFGGSLGTSYWRHRDMLAGFSDVRWDVVEQPGFVTAGRKHFPGGPVRFFASVDEALGTQGYDVILASGVVQYLANPAPVIRTWMQSGPAWLLFNNLPLHGRPDQIMVQDVPAEIYRASYPVRFFNRESFLRQFSGSHRVIRAFSSEAVWPLGWHLLASTGLLLRREPW